MSKTKEWYMREHLEENAETDKMKIDNIFTY
jgi:hypothetical protein